MRSHRLAEAAFLLWKSRLFRGHVFYRLRSCCALVSFLSSCSFRPSHGNSFQVASPNILTISLGFTELYLPTNSPFTKLPSVTVFPTRAVIVTLQIQNSGTLQGWTPFLGSTLEICGTILGCHNNWGCVAGIFWVGRQVCCIPCHMWESSTQQRIISYPIRLSKAPTGHSYVWKNPFTKMWVRTNFVLQTQGIFIHRNTDFVIYWNFQKCNYCVHWGNILLSYVRNFIKNCSPSWKIMSPMAILLL